MAGQLVQSLDGLAQCPDVNIAIEGACGQLLSVRRESQRHYRGVIKALDQKVSLLRKAPQSERATHAACRQNTIVRRKSQRFDSRFVERLEREQLFARLNVPHENAAFSMPLCKHL